MVPEGIDDSALLWLAEGINNEGHMGRQLSQDVFSEGPSSQTSSLLSRRSQVSGLPVSSRSGH